MMNVAVVAAVESKHGDEKFAIKPIYVEHGGLRSSVCTLENSGAFEPCMNRAV